MGAAAPGGGCIAHAARLGPEAHPTNFWAVLTCFLLSRAARQPPGRRMRLGARGEPFVLVCEAALEAACEVLLREPRMKLGEQCRRRCRPCRRLLLPAACLFDMPPCPECYSPQPSLERSWSAAWPTAPLAWPCCGCGTAGGTGGQRRQGRSRSLRPPMDGALAAWLTQLMRQSRQTPSRR